MFDKALKRVNTFEDFRTELVKEKEKRAGAELTQETVKKQKVEDDKETTELKQLIEIIPDKEEVAIDAIPLAVNQMLKSFDRELWSTFLKDATCADLYVGREEISPYTTYTDNDVAKEAYY
ncbi:hypothetical protein Tco_0857796 [Tanacetum coccineum]|uniref:Uncharacterized protein n=1 Tax=Tanacetum coccineum TaxID=301880 RepID=A0ABQ5BBF6_9ASTR